MNLKTQILRNLNPPQKEEEQEMRWFLCMILTATNGFQDQVVKKLSQLNDWGKFFHIDVFFQLRILEVTDNKITSCAYFWLLGISSFKANVKKTMAPKQVISAIWSWLWLTFLLYFPLTCFTRKMWIFNHVEVKDIG